MTEKFADMLLVGEHRNSLGRAGEVVQIVLSDKSRLDELYDCLYGDDAWVRMRAADALEKVCRAHPEWVASYIDRLFALVATTDQPSILWHMAQILGEVALAPPQKQQAIRWLVSQLDSTDVDWIVAANCMDTLQKFRQDGSFAVEDFIPLLHRQQQHHSKAVVRRATKILAHLQG